MASNVDAPIPGGQQDNETVDLKKRRFLVAATSAVGATGTVMLAAPFVLSISPSERAQAAGAPVEVDVGKLEDGQIMRIEWRKKPVWIVRRTTAMLDALKKNDEYLKDPDSDIKTQQPKYATNPYRSIKPEYLVLVGICTHLGCSPTFRPEVAPSDLGDLWNGGFYCPCHGSRYDLAGRVYQNVPASKNLEVPPYAFLSETLILVGKDSGIV